MFDPVAPQVSFAELDQKWLDFWDEHAVFEASTKQNAEGKSFVFYEGPPTANGMPHPGHVLTRVMKDVFLRYRSMCGYHVPRRAGWDTHGLPVEVEVEKELGIHGREAIEAYGVEAFSRKCVDSVFRYIDAWRDMTRRIAFWVDLDDAYVTFHKPYVESVWWALKRFFDEGLLYQDYKILWWWPQGGTALSAGEVGQGYKEVDDPSVVIRFPVKGEANTSFLAWTTTPWTLPSNVALAVGPDTPYATVKLASGEQVILAISLRRAHRRRSLPGHPRRLRHHRLGVGHGPRRAGLRRRRLPGRQRGGPRLPPTRRARRDLQSIRDRLRRALLQGSRPGHHPEPPDTRDPLRRGGLPPRVPLLLARDERPPHPVRPQELVHSHHSGNRPTHRVQRGDSLGAEAHQGRTHGRVPAHQCGLGSEPRALLGHAASYLGQRRDRQVRSRRLRQRDPQEEPRRLRGLRRSPRQGSLAERAPHRAQAVDRRRDVDERGRARGVPSGPRGDRLLVRLRRDALRSVGIPPPERRQVRTDLPRRLHLRGPRPDPRLVLHADDHQHPPAPGPTEPAPVQELRRPRPDRRQERQEDVQAGPKLFGPDGAHGQARRRLGALGALHQHRARSV
ncbi:MAG: class I tRNA ligase family protein, partial [Deltaproteobacteria bacterium]|nr:class I tRNA ligase family protein [Deltaproteobacteria bacterium]